MNEVSKRRVFLGGLFEDVTDTDLKDRFQRFGTVTSVEVKNKKSQGGTLDKTFAYLDLHISEKNYQKCLATYNKTRWRGGIVYIQPAKDSFIARLEKERKSIQLEKQSEVPQQTEPVEHSYQPRVKKRLENFKEAGVKDYCLEKAVPGTPINGERNWVVGKYGRVLPIVYLRRPDKKKVMKLDPSKYVHHLKVMKEEDSITKQDVKKTNSLSTGLTWNVPEVTSDDYKKRKGDFSRIKWSPKKHKKHSNVTIFNNNYELDHSRMHSEMSPSQNNRVKQQKFSSNENLYMVDTKEDNVEDFEVVKVADSVKNPVSSYSGFLLSLNRKGNKWNLNKKNIKSSSTKKDYDSDEESCGSADTDQICAVKTQRTVINQDGIKNLRYRDKNDSREIITYSKLHQLNLQEQSKATASHVKSSYLKLHPNETNNAKNFPEYSSSSDYESSEDGSTSASDFHDKGKSSGIDSDRNDGIPKKQDDSKLKQIKQAKSVSYIANVATSTQHDNDKNSSDSEDGFQETFAKSALTRHIKQVNLAALMSEGSSDESEDSSELPSKVSNKKPSDEEEDSGKDSSESSDSDSESSESRSDSPLADDSSKLNPIKQANSVSSVDNTATSTQRVHLNSKNDKSSSDSEDDFQETFAKSAHTSQIKQVHLATLMSKSSSDESEDSSDVLSKNSKKEPSDEEKDSGKSSDSDRESSDSDSELSDSSSDSPPADDSSIRISTSDGKLSRLDVKQYSRIMNQASEEDIESGQRLSKSKRNSKFEEAFITLGQYHTHDANGKKAREQTLTSPFVKDSTPNHERQKQKKLDGITFNIKDAEVNILPQTVKGKDGAPSVKKKTLSNEARLESMKRKQTEMSKQQALIQGALTSVDLKASKNIGKHFRFDDDTSDSESEDKQEEKDGIKEKKKSSKNGPQLFVSDEEEQEDDKDSFKWVMDPQFEGKEGAKLMKLQSRFGGDDRFKLDTRFLDEGKDTNPDVDDTEVNEEDQDLKEEREKSMAILERIVGIHAMAKNKASLQDPKYTFKDLSALHYDPSNEEHSKFEQKVPDSSVSVEKERHLNSTLREELPAPEVTKDRFYEVSNTLKDAFSGPSRGTGSIGEATPFTFFPQEDEDENDKPAVKNTDEPSATPLTTQDLMWKPKKFRYDSSDSDEDNEGTLSAMSNKRIADEIEKDTEVEEQVPMKFFFQENDVRLRDGPLWFFNVPKSGYREEKMNEKKEELKAGFRKRHQRAVRTWNRKKMEKQKRKPKR